MGLDPRIWGPKGWFFLHSIALNYPKNPTDHDKRNFKQFFESIQYVLPCPQCAQHYSENLQKNPIDPQLKDNISLNKWLVEMHNLVNRHYYKPTITYEDFLKNYKDIYNNSNSSTDMLPQSVDYTNIFIVGCIVVLCMLFVYKKHH